MSKSSGEFLTVSLLEEKGYDSLAYRFFCLQSHYRKSLVFTYENLDNAATAYKKLTAKVAALIAENEKKPAEVDAEALAALKKRFTDALDNDLNTSLAVTALYDVLKAQTNAATKLAAFDDFDRVLSLSLTDAARAQIEEEKKKAADAAAAAAAAHAGDPEAQEIQALVDARTAAKKAKNFAEADRIRNELSARGIVIVDTPAGPTWHRQ